MPGIGIYRSSMQTPWVIEEPRAPEQQIDMIILHFTELNYEQSFRVLTEPHTVSAHYLVREDGRIDNLVSLKSKAWHAGSSYWRWKEKINNNSIGIEIVNLGYDDSCYDLDSNKKASECQVFSFTEQ